MHSGINTGRFLLLFAFLATACNEAFPYRPLQLEAEQIVWRDAYGMSEDPPPVEWVHARRLLDEPIVRGQTLIGWKVRVACGNDCEFPIRGTSYAHELFHWRCWLRTGDVDAAHSHCDWSIVEHALDLMYLDPLLGPET